MAPILSAFKSLPSQLAWIVGILALSLTSESAKTALFCLLGGTMSDWNTYKNHLRLYDVWINESIKPF